MAIQIPNPGTGNGASGDNEFVLWSKVKDNFTDQTNAASRLVGTSAGQVPIYKTSGSLGTPTIDGTGWGGTQGQTTFTTASEFLTHLFSGGSKVLRNQTATSVSEAYGTGIYCAAVDTYFMISSSYAGNKVIVASGLKSSGVDGVKVQELYTNKNTTKDVGTGFLKVSSPVLHVYNDKIDKIHEAEQLDITVDKKGVGHYEIHGTTGLRQNDGWNMSPPRDIHGNVRCMIEVTEKDGVITVRTYKRKFDLDLAAIVHDYDNPLDIPDGACVELRFNDLPQENLDDTQTEV